MKNTSHSAMVVVQGISTAFLGWWSHRISRTSWSVGEPGA